MILSVVWAALKSRRRLKAAGSLACVAAAFSTGCGEGAADPARLPETVDVAFLRGTALPGTGCRFADDLEQVPLAAGERASRVWLNCPETEDGSEVGLVEVRPVLSGSEPPEDRISCHGDPKAPSLYTCDARHRMVIVNARAVCGPDPCSDSDDRARELMAGILKLLATLPG